MPWNLWSKQSLFLPIATGTSVRCPPFTGVIVLQDVLLSSRASRKSSDFKNFHFSRDSCTLPCGRPWWMCLSIWTDYSENFTSKPEMSERMAKIFPHVWTLGTQLQLPRSSWHVYLFFPPPKFLSLTVAMTMWMQLICNGTSERTTHPKKKKKKKTTWLEKVYLKTKARSHGMIIIHASWYVH